MRILLVLIGLNAPWVCNAQQWRVNITIQLLRGSIPMYGIDTASIDFAGQHMDFINAGNPHSVSFYGTGSPTGNLSIYATALDETLHTIYGIYEGVIPANCNTQQIVTHYGPGRMQATVTFYPALILSPSNSKIDCTGGTQPLSLTFCATTEVEWSVRQGTGSYQTISGVTGTQLNVNSNLLTSVGYSVPYGSFQFKAYATTPGMESAVAVVNIYPPGVAQIGSSAQDPQCFGGLGKISISATSTESNIDKFKASLYSEYHNPGSFVGTTQNFSSSLTFSGLPAGDYWVVIENDPSDASTYGNCASEWLALPIIKDPPPLSVSITPSGFNGYNISCNGASNGTITANVSNSVGSVTYTWSGSGTASSNVLSSCGPGNHSVFVRDANNCTATSSTIDMQEPSALSLSLSAVDATCNGSADGAINSLVSGGAGGYSYYWNNGGSTQAIGGLPAGNYWITVQDANNCNISTGVHINQPQPITFSITEDHGIDCPGTATGALSINLASLQNQQGITTQSWSTGESNTSITGKPAGTYSVTVSDARNCTAQVNYTLTDPLPFIVQISSATNYNGSAISCNGASDGKLQATLFDNNNQVVTTQNFTWQRNNAPLLFGSSVADDVNAATYTASASYGPSQACTATSQPYQLTQPTPVTVQISPTSNHHGLFISCPGEDDGTLTANASGGTLGNYTYQWDNGPAAKNFDGLIAGTYFVTAYDINNCAGSTSYQLNDPPPVVPSIDIVSDYHGQAITCAGASDAKLSASATGGALPYLFTWSTGSGGVNVNNLPAGSYSVEATDANGCKMETQPIEIVDPVPVNASITILSNYNGQAIRCFNDASGSVRAHGLGGTSSYSYLWNTSAVTQDVSGLAHGTYSVVVSDQNGCSDVATIELINPEPVILTLNTLSSYNGFGVQCHGAQNGFIEVIANGGTNNFTFNWPSLFQTTSRVEDLGAGDYGVSVTDSNGCSDGGTFEITEPPVLTLEELNHVDINCYGGSDGVLTVKSAGGFGIYEYSINSGGWQLLPNFASLVANVSYVVTVKDENQCEAIFETELAQPEEIEIDFNISPAMCADPVGKASAEVSGGVGGFTFEWKDQLGKIFSVYPSVTKLLPGIYTFTVHDSHQCPMEKPIGIPSIDGPEVLIVENKPTSCFDSADGYSRIDVVSNKGPFIVMWDGGANTFEVDNLNRGVHYVSVTDVNKCVGVVPVVMTSPEAISVSVVEKSNVSCHSSCDGAIKVEATGGNGGYKFAWNDVAGNSSANSLCVGTHQVEVTDKLGCRGSQVFTITQPDQLELRAVSRKLPTCNGGCNGSIEVLASGGTGAYSYLWVAGSKSNIQENICAGNYSVMASDAMNCATSRIFDLGEPTKVDIALLENKSPTCHDLCDGTIEVAAHGGAGGYRFAWPDGSSLSKNSALCVGEQQVTVTDINNCSANAKYTISNVPALKIDLGGGAVVCEGQEHELDAGPSWKEVEWRNSGTWISSSQKITISRPGTYSVQVFDSKNCSATDSFVLETSDDLLQASFIVTGEAIVDDTVAIIDISWPMPDSITWSFPEEMIKIVDHGDFVHGKFSTAGEYDIVLHAKLGQCNDEIKKTIVILDNDHEASGGRLGVEQFVKSFSVYPNPNTGTFEVEVEFVEQTPITMTIWNLGTAQLVSKVADDGSSQYKRHFNLQPITSGTYLLRVDYNGGHRIIRFLVH